MKNNLKIRDSNYELMRIISMFLIVLSHVILYGVGLKDTSPKLKLILDFIQVLIIIHVNSYILLTGYFQYNKKTNIKKIFSILNGSWFYRMLITFLLLSFGVCTLTNLNILRNISYFPISYEHWFIHNYVLLYLFSPYLNKLISVMNQKEYKRLLLICFVICSVLTYMTNQEFFTVNRGFSLYQFIYLYFIGAYLHKYPLKDSYHFKNINMKTFRILCVITFVTCAFINCSILYFGKYLVTISAPDSILREVSNVFTSLYFSYDFPFTVIQSISFFLLFGTFNFKNKFINYVSSLTLGIYFIHETEILKPYLYKFFKFDISTSGMYILIRVFIIAIIIFVTCALIEAFRKTIINLLKMIFKKRKIEKIV